MKFLLLKSALTFACGTGVRKTVFFDDIISQIQCANKNVTMKATK